MHPKRWLTALPRLFQLWLAGLAFERNHPYAEERQIARDVIRRLSRLPDKTGAIRAQIEAAQAILREPAPPNPSRKWSPSEAAEVVTKEAEERISEVLARIEAKKEVAQTTSLGTR